MHPLSSSYLEPAPDAEKSKAEWDEWVDLCEPYKSHNEVWHIKH
jgi:hypothetical protein